MKRPSSRLAHSRLVPPHRRSEVHSSVYQTPPEYADPPNSPPLPSARLLPATRPLSPLPTQPGSPVSVQLATQLHRMMQAAPSSSEYLERYQPLAGSDWRRPEVAGGRASRTTTLTGDAREVAGGESETDETERESVQERRRRGVGAELKRFFTGR